ncbi:unnamed protein product [Bursaphelenchus okinawaensis]|uniref:CWH43-like N-terminal domain-containing protein n=1 Tax=Bursaphelenchus okinawaensis TaxID=465554 RepID=A0A811KCL4_9BILA|nr:unnamed protein product [Bursaphelenchus okinawaensis]CAG9101000.1 unnamed protein product [Bursaphelenchus okinawaensis]
MVTIWTPIFPLLCSSTCLIGVLSGYAIAASLDHVLPWLPIISEGGVLIPERGVFGTFLNFSGLFWFFNGICLYIHMKDYLQKHSPKLKLRYMLYVMLFIVVESSFGFTFVANFQVHHGLLIHGIGAAMMFYGGLIYFGCYVAFSLKHRLYTSLCLTVVRLVLIVPTAVFVCLHKLFLDTPVIVPAVNGTVPFKPHKKVDGIDRIAFGEPWWYNHFISASSEWIATFLFLFIIATLAYDLREMYVTFNLYDHDPRKVKKRAESSIIDQNGKSTEKEDTKSEEKGSKTSWETSN